MTTKYWMAIQRELETGCTCTSFDSNGRLIECDCSFSPSTMKMPSRIPGLIIELLEVLLSVISPSQPPQAASSSSSSIPLPPGIPPTVYHHPSYTAQEAQLRAALDPRLIAQELKHGVFDPKGLFELLGSVLKCHCAPMRDRHVDLMVSVALGCKREGMRGMGDAVRAIRTCFEILELMKLVSGFVCLLALDRCS